ncbi:F0F1 ATP synthase subunit delta [Paenibacillus sp. GCM10012307]|uniref:ATP synthase subunit delta n=1 Tax=Paenibacillus roseus TaxID=2798579 RepID=A0A934ML78_9BACL|nr:F0F1 ATP synthase subunit delta [Paenibacillus roseus]MBJ6361885.1 F0F1 ATP synthase subunit delta [Paenibacillus roseus]
MSRDTVVAKRYAKALFELAQQNNAVAAVESELGLVAQAIAGDEQVSKFLGTPNISSDAKSELLKTALNGHVSEDVLRSIDLLISRGRIGIISEVYEAYKKIAGEALGQADATVYTAQKLSEEELAKVAAQFGALIGKKIRATQIEAPALLGGIQVRIGDRLYDGSLSGKLERLEKSLKA